MKQATDSPPPLFPSIATPGFETPSDRFDRLDPAVDFSMPARSIDVLALGSMVLFLLLLGTAIIWGQDGSNVLQFLNAPSALLVILGSIALTTLSFSAADTRDLGRALVRTLTPERDDIDHLARNLVALSIIARKRGILALNNYEYQYRRDPFLAVAMRLVIDGHPVHDLHHILDHEQTSFHERGATPPRMLARMAEIAPAMGLIGTLIGLIQMLTVLDDPSQIGPAMALALLTTFYGALLGTAVCTPLAQKMEAALGRGHQRMQLIRAAAEGIQRQDNPRTVEMALNALLPVSRRISLFE